ncbi:MAG TPA: hypothetical protein VJS90_12015 [Pseudomonas sp.]|uniref:hypothetical protein n=1 Tax=Pseudomonas sp. TaxID=306 RepID=UPI002B46E5DA|nr:hypothetical protein [Pseudomonas sp.]HKS13751.1 hypothetical protein [Pseudomonas sp.]
MPEILAAICTWQVSIAGVKPCPSSPQNDRKVAFLLRPGEFDKAGLFSECVRTQIKRPYELSVCLSNIAPMHRAIAPTGVPGGPAASDRRVQFFSFHIVEIS